MSERLEFIRSLQNKEIKKPIIEIGENCIICETAKLGNEGFGFEPDENGNQVFFPHFGGVKIGNNVRIGSYTCIDRGNLKDTIIEDDVKIDNLVHVAHNVKIGKHTLVVAGSVICGSVEIGESCFIGAKSVIKQHIKIGNNVTIGMGSVVTKNIPDGETWAGNPAVKIEKLNFFKHKTSIVESNDIGDGTKIWAFSHISKGSKIGKNCVIGENVYIGNNVIIGDNCKIQNNSLVYEGVILEDNVFFGPNTVTTNDFKPEVGGDWKNNGRFKQTIFRNGCSIGANSVIVCGVEIGENALVGAGSVVTKNIPSNSLSFGNPSRLIKNKK
jgi:UDP-2-acetamido-3-amino-2,3-dideoxy-glucuronate N-acetyltransferase